MARKIVVPSDTITIEFMDERGVERARPFPWTEFVTGLCRDQRFVDGCSDVFEAIDLRKKLLEAAAPGASCSLEDAAWGVVTAIAKKPPFAPFVCFQIEPYLRAITDAPCA